MLILASMVAMADPLAGCNIHGCWTNGGGCNIHGCWNSPAGSCNIHGCSDHGECNIHGCPQAPAQEVRHRPGRTLPAETSAPAGSCNIHGCWSNGGGCNIHGCWNSPIGSCNIHGCSDYGECTINGCPQGPGTVARTPSGRQLPSTAVGALRCSIYGVQIPDEPAGCGINGCWEYGGGCNINGCWRNGGGCNINGCWNSPVGSCNINGCTDYGECTINGCPRPPGPAELVCVRR